MRNALSAGLACCLIVSPLLAQPDPSHTSATGPVWSPPDSLDELPAQPLLPDLLTSEDGTPVKTAADWHRRREELKAMLLYYQYGHLPKRPDQVTVVETQRREHESGLGTLESMTLEIDSRKRLRFRAVLYLPHHAGRRPVIIREEDRLGQREDVGMFLEKGYIFVEYARHDLDPDRDRVVGTAQAAYPNHDWATLAVWAWCGMRLVDYLESRDDVDLDRIGITGHSRGGKMALLTAALDERIGLVVPHQSGSGGAGCYRVLGPGAETLAQNDKPHWYHERIRWFGEQEERLPIDQHFLKALVAPRALLCTESVDDEFANPLGSLVTSVAAQQVYELLGVPEKNAIHFRRGGHSTDTEDWARILSFAEWHFFGRRPADAESHWPGRFSLPAGYATGNLRRELHTVGEDAEVAGRFVDPPEPTAADVFVTVAAAGNRADRDLHGQGRYGAVSHSFEIAEREVDQYEYARFLNAVAAEDDAGNLYHEAMATMPASIRRVATGSGFRYQIRADQPRRAVTHVSWFDAVRYCNWLHHGRPRGKQGPQTTETGAYRLADLAAAIQRTSEAKYFLPTEDEWYKAAYFDGTASGGSYRHFAPGATNRPLIDRPQPHMISPWGMAGFADPTWEWTESQVGRLHRSVRSAAWFLGNNKQSAGHFYCNPQIEYPTIGFRVARRTESP